MERLPHSPESKRGAETGELEHNAAERLKHLQDKAERAGDGNAEQAAEAARDIIKQVEAPAPVEQPQGERQVGPSGLTRRISYEFTMKSMRQRLSPASRSFSKFIHNPTIEATSEVIGKTILRPSISIGATTTAFLVGLFLYLTARQYGFVLRGSAIWIALIIGAVIGLFAEGLYKLFRKAGPNSSR